MRVFDGGSWGYLPFIAAQSAPHEGWIHVTDELRINDWGSVEQLWDAMRIIEDQATAINGYIGTHVCSKAGFDGPVNALQPLGWAMDAITEAFTSMTEEFQKRWDQTGAATALAIKDFDETDGDVDNTFYGGYLAVVQLTPTQGPS